MASALRAVVNVVAVVCFSMCCRFAYAQGQLHMGPVADPKTENRSGVWGKFLENSMQK